MLDPTPPAEVSLPEQPFNPAVFLETGQKLIDSGLAKAVYRPTKSGQEIVAAVLPFAEKKWLAFTLTDLQTIMFSLESPESVEKFGNDANQLNVSGTTHTSLANLIDSAQGMRSGFVVLADSKDNPDAIIDALPKAIEYSKAKLEQMKANRQKVAEAAIEQFKSLGFD